MKKIVYLLIAVFLFCATSVFAHCGKCGLASKGSMSTEEKVLRAQKKASIKIRREIINESNQLLNAIEEQTPYKSDKRWRYEELLNIYAERPIESLPVDEQEETANKLLAQATTRLIELLKEQSIEEAKKGRGEQHEEIIVSDDLLVELNQYTQLVKRIEQSKVAQHEKIVTKKEKVIESTEELIALLKEEAIKRAAAKKIAAKQKLSLKKFEGTLGFHYGYDNNVNADTAFEGGQFIRNYFSLDWFPFFNQYLKPKIGIWYLGDNYTDYSDVTFRIAAGNTSLKWYPYGNNTLLIEPGYEFSDTYYPDNESVSTKEYKVTLHTKLRFWENWVQELNYENLQSKNNDNRLARNGLGVNFLDNPLVKRRHTINYNISMPFAYNSTLKLKQRGQRQTSNDAFTDFYDYYSYQVETEISRSITEKIYAKASLGFEQKDYSHRTVDEIQVAQEDRAYTQKLTLFYFLDADWLVNYTWRRSKVDSNSPIYDYEKMSHLIGVYYSF